LKSTTFAGRLGQPLELKSVGANNTSLLEFDLAVTVWDRRESKEVTEWWPVTVWGRDAEYLSNYAQVGDAILIEGELQQEKYLSKKYTDSEGNGCPMVRTKINANLGSVELYKKGTASPRGGNSPATASAAGPVDTEDDIPF